MKLFNFKYPKITLLVIAVILAYFIFSNQQVQNFVFNLDKLSYLGIFFAGLLLAFGFTAPFAIGFFLTLNLLNPSDIILSALIGGIGAASGDFLIFKLIKISFKDEFEKLENTQPFKTASQLIEKNLGHKIKIYLMYIFAEFLIVSPLPDEIGITMIAGLTKIKPSFLAISSLILHTFALLILLCI